MLDTLPNCPLILHKKYQNTLANLNCREGKVINDTLFFCSVFSVYWYKFFQKNTENRTDLKL